MNKEEQYISGNDELLERAKDFLDHGDKYSEEQLHLLAGDESFQQAVAEVLSCEENIYAGSERLVTDVDEAWENFKRDKTIKHKRQIRFSYYKYILVAAASLLLVLGYAWMKKGQVQDLESKQTAMTVEEGTVFQVTQGKQDIVLKTDKGKEIILSEPEDVKKMLVENSQVKPHVQTVMIPRGKTYKMTLSDGTIVWLNADSQLEYPTRFVGDVRFVRLQGEAYFKVHPDASHPFVIETDQVRTRVLGTEFNVRSYPGTPAQVTLVSGSVALSRSNVKGSRNEILLSPGQMAQVDDQSTAFQVVEVNTDAFTYWNEGYFFYNSETLLVILQDIGRWYNMNVVFKNEEAKEFKMHFTCERSESIGQVVNLLNETQKVNISIRGNTIYIQ